MESLLSRLAPNYEALAKLGEGGMGTVYRVRHRHLNKVRVAKIMRRTLRGDAKLVARFQHEAKLLSGLTHPNIAQIFELFVSDDGDAAIIMEWVPGEDLRRLCRRLGPVPLATGLEIGRQTLSALQHLHERHYVHRDISPDNLMVSWQAEPDDDAPGVQVKMIDLGIAKSLQDNAGMTATGNFLGKVRYSSPERLSAEGRLDQRSDLYSFAVVLYEALTGHCPIQGTAPESLISGHLFRHPKSFEETDPDDKIPQALREVLLSLLAKKPEDRPDSAAHLLHTWAELQGESPPDVDADAPWTRQIRAATEALNTESHSAEHTLSVTASITATIGSQVPGAQVPGAQVPGSPTPRPADDDDDDVPERLDTTEGPPRRDVRPAGDSDVDATTMLYSERPGQTKTSAGVGRLVTAAGSLALLLLIVVPLWIWDQTTTSPTTSTTPSDAESSLEAEPVEEDATSSGLDPESPAPGSPAPESPAPGSTAPEEILTEEPDRDAQAAQDAQDAQAQESTLERPALEPPPPGRLVLLSTPWAKLVTLQTTDGRPRALPEPAETPLALDLLPGDYEVELHNPQLGMSRRLTVTVRSGADSRHTITFEEVDPDALLRSLGF